MNIKFLNCPSWSGAYIMAMLVALAPADITLDDGIAVYTCGGEL